MEFTIFVATTLGVDVNPIGCFELVVTLVVGRCVVTVECWLEDLVDISDEAGVKFDDEVEDKDERNTVGLVLESVVDTLDVTSPDVDGNVVEMTVFIDDVVLLNGFVFNVGDIEVGNVEDNILLETGVSLFVVVLYP